MSKEWTNVTTPPDDASNEHVTSDKEANCDECQSLRRSTHSTSTDAVGGERMPQGMGLQPLNVQEGTPEPDTLNELSTPGVPPAELPPIRRGSKFC